MPIYEFNPVEAAAGGKLPEIKAYAVRFILPNGARIDARIDEDGFLALYAEGGNSMCDRLAILPAVSNAVRIGVVPHVNPLGQAPSAGRTREG